MYENFSLSQLFEEADLIGSKYQTLEERALQTLNIEIEKGYEFPEAVSRTFAAHPIRQSVLVSLYDAQ